MKVDEALELADEWIKGVTMYEDAQDWRVACATLAAEVRRVREDGEYEAGYQHGLSDGREELQDTCHRQAQQLAASQHYAERLREALEYLREHKLWANSHAKAIIDSALAKVGAGETAPEGHNAKVTGAAASSPRPVD